MFMPCSHAQEVTHLVGHISVLRVWSRAYLSGSSQKLQNASGLQCWHKFSSGFWNNSHTNTCSSFLVFTSHASTTQQWNQQSYGAISSGCVFPPLSPSPDKRHKRIPAVRFENVVWWGCFISSNDTCSHMCAQGGDEIPVVPSGRDKRRVL